MDNLYEESIQKTNLQSAKMFKITMILVCIVSSVMAFLEIFFVFGSEFTLPGFIALLLLLAVAIISFVIRNRLFFEVDYTFYAEVLEFEAAKVINNSKRKELASANVKEFIIVAPVDSYEYSRHSEGADKKINATVNPDAKHYFAVYKDKHGKKNVLVFEPSQTLLNQIKRKIPSKVMV